MDKNSTNISISKNDCSQTPSNLSSSREFTTNWNFENDGLYFTYDNWKKNKDSTNMNQLENVYRSRYNRFRVENNRSKSTESFTNQAKIWNGDVNNTYTDDIS